MGNRYSPEQVKAVVRLEQSGVPIEKIAEQINTEKICPKSIWHKSQKLNRNKITGILFRHQQSKPQQGDRAANGEVVPAITQKLVRRYQDDPVHNELRQRRRDSLHIDNTGNLKDAFIPPATASLISSQVRGKCCWPYGKTEYCGAEVFQVGPRERFYCPYHLLKSLRETPAKDSILLDLQRRRISTSDPHTKK